MKAMKTTAVRSIVVVMLAWTLLFGCSGMSDTQQKTLSGGAIGAAGGAAITAIAGGNAATGAAIGGGVGALSGYIMSK